MILQKEYPHDDSIKEEDIMYSYCTYIAENAESLNLVEGEKVFVLGMRKKIHCSLFNRIQISILTNSDFFCVLQRKT